MKTCAVFSTIRAGVIAIGVLLTAALSTAADWGGNLTGTYSGTQRGAGDTESYDQRYRLFVSTSNSAALRHTAFLYYRTIQTFPETGSASRREELQPSFKSTWTTPVLRAGGSYLYRKYVDDNAANELIGQEASADVSTTIQNAPRFHGRYAWLQNENNLELLGRDTRQQTISGGVDYHLRQLSLQYDYTDRTTRNANTGFEQLSRQHQGIANYFLRLNSKASLSSNYQVNHRTDSEQRADSTSLLLVPAATGLYAADATPDFDELDASPQLIDNVIDLAIVPEINLSSDEFHNLGLDFGTVTQIDRLHLYTDTLAVTTLRWRIFISDDNLNWTEHRGTQADFFSDAFLRYEISFSAVNTRYVKLVSVPQPDVNPVHVTELRALRTREEADRSIETTDHRGALDFRYRPAKWLSAGAGGTIYRRDRSLLQPGRDEESLNGMVRIRPAEHSVVTGQYFFDRTKANDADGVLTERERFVGGVETDWDRTFATTFTASRTFEWTDNVRSRRTDVLRATGRMKLLPDLSATVDVTRSEDSRAQSDDLFKTNLLSAGIDSRPVDRATFTLRGTWMELESRSGAGTPYRRSFYGDLTYRITDRISVRSNASVSEERSTTSAQGSAQLSWKITRKIVISGSARRTETETIEKYETQLYSLQSTYSITRATRLSGGWSRSETGVGVLDKLTTLRVSFETRF